MLKTGVAREASATIKVPISGTNRCTQRMNKIGEVRFDGLKIPNPRRDIKSVVIHIYFFTLYKFTLAY
jgi:phosphatidylethanolamine-binding protein (PEBP) family uncharacterized protein